MHTRPIRITRAGSLGRAEFRALGSTVTILATKPGAIAQCALAVRRGLTVLDVTGGPGRARATDRLAALAAEAAGCGVLLSIGGDIAVGGTGPARGWRVRIDDGRGADADVIRLRVGGLATVRSAGSSAARPDPVWKSVTVAAGSCREARSVALSAAARGQSAAPWLDSLGLAARMVATADGVVVHTGRWPAEPAAA